MGQENDIDDYIDRSCFVDEQTYSLLTARHRVPLPQAATSHQGTPESAETRITQLQSEMEKLQIEIDQLQKVLESKDQEIKVLQERPAQGSRGSFSTLNNTCEPPEHRYNNTETLIHNEMSTQADIHKFDATGFDDALTMLQDQYPQQLLCNTEGDLDMGSATEIDESKIERKRKRSSPMPPIKKHRDGIQLLHATASLDKASSKSPETSDHQVSQSEDQIRDPTTVEPSKHISVASYVQTAGPTRMNTTIMDPVDSNDTNEPDQQDYPFYERRPKTWPLRQAFRQSVDISIKTIVKRFERLRA